VIWRTRRIPHRTIGAREGSIVSSAKSLWVRSSPKNTACSSLTAKLWQPLPSPRMPSLLHREREDSIPARGQRRAGHAAPPIVCRACARSFRGSTSIVTLGRPQEPAATACHAKASTRLDPRAGSCVANAPGTLRARFNCGVAYAHTVHATPAFHGRCVNPRGVAFGAFRCSKLATLPASGLNLSHVLN
jgi:hypothetical protein